MLLNETDSPCFHVNLNRPNNVQGLFVIGPAVHARSPGEVLKPRLHGAGIDMARDRSTTDPTIIQPEDICLGYLDQDSETWKCFLEDRESRLAQPVWTEDVGGHRWRVEGLLETCDHSMVAFLNIPLDDEVIVYVVVPTWLQDNTDLVIQIIAIVVVCLLLCFNGLWRVSRYRKKYRTAKEDHQLARNRANQIYKEEAAIGNYDDELDFVANPLNLKIQKAKVAAKTLLKHQRERDRQEIDALTQQRQKIASDISRMQKLLLEANKKKQATRVVQAGAFETFPERAVSNNGPRQYANQDDGDDEDELLELQNLWYVLTQ